MITITPYNTFKSFYPKVLVSSLQLIVFLLLSGNSGFCQNIAFNKVFPPNRTSFLQLTDITQDKNGIMWFASNIGLYSYNGYEMISYKNNQMDPNSLAGDILRSVCADNEGNIWIAVQDEGIDKFDPVTGIFTHYKPDPDDPGSLNSDWVNVMKVGRDGVLWIGSGQGLTRYDIRNDKFIHYKNIPGDSTSLSYNEVVTIYEDREETLWIGTGSVYGADQNDFEAGGLNKFDKETETFRRFKHNPENQNSLVNNKVSAIFEDSKGILWIGTAGDGLHTMDKSAEIIARHRYDPNQPNKLSRPPLNLSNPTDHIRFIMEDVTGAIWIGTLDAGLNYYNPVTKEITHFESENNSPGAFTDQTTWAAFASRDGVLWISTLFGTLYRIDPMQSEIPYVELSGQNVQCFYEEKNGTLWWGSNKVFVSGNMHERLIQMINSEFQQAASNYNYVRVIQEDSKGNILIGGGGGLIILNLVTKEFTHYVHDPDDDNTLSNNNITSISEDSKNNLWIGTLSGLNRLNPATREIKRFLIDDEKTDMFGPNYILDVQLDDEDKTWVALGSGIGLCMLNESSGEFEQYKDVYAVNCLIKDSNGILWAGTSDGLIYYDLVKKVYIRYTDLNSYNEISTVSNIIEDDDKNLWVSTGSGIIKINALRTVTKNYGANYGVYSEILNRNVCYKDHKGFLYFGGKNGYYKFLPSEIITNSRPPLVTISGFHVSDPEENAVAIQKAENVSLLNEIILRYNQNTFSFDFAVIDYSNPAANQHYFMLKNYDDDWRKANADRRAHFFNIQPGRYTFRVKGANSYGVWAEKTINIIINPPWWKTWWAYALYGMLFIGFVIMVDHIQRKRLLAKAHEEAKERELRQAREIEKAYRDLKATQAQLIQSEKMASLGELTAGIAHEIQNPLNFVNNFSEVNIELMEELKAESSKLKAQRDEALEEELWRDLQENEKKINHHGKRADAIVKAMLQHSRTSSGIKEPTDINALADEYLRLSYHGLRAKDKSFNADFMTELEPALPRINVIPQDIGRVLLNLINNAFHAVSEKAKKGIPDYKPLVTVKTKRHDSLVEIRVKDNGDGIPDDIVNKIFQPFFTTKPTGEGTGLGLSLSYDIVTKGHNGTLEVDTAAGLGSEFIVSLPVG
jgi:signal transduction histidine kinase/ligand-binding sensor domain-containing protein